MKDVYKEAMIEKLNEMSLINNNPKINDTLNIQLPNSSDLTDYDSWIEGSKRFAKDNYELLKEYIG